MGNKRGYTKAFDRLGDVYLNEGNENKAIEYYTRTLNDGCSY